MRTAAETRRSLAMDLRGALASDQLAVVYQPIFDVQQARLAGFDALLRWTHPARAVVSPEPFIPLVQNSALIQSLVARFLRTACMQSGQLQQPSRNEGKLSPLPL